MKLHHLDEERASGLHKATCGGLFPEGQVTDEPGRVTCKACSRKLRRAAKAREAMHTPEATSGTFDGYYAATDAEFLEASRDGLRMGPNLTRREAELWAYALRPTAGLIASEADENRRFPRTHGARWDSLRQALAVYAHVKRCGHKAGSLSDPDSFARRAGLMGTDYSPPGPPSSMRLAEDMAEIDKALNAAAIAVNDEWLSPGECKAVFLAARCNPSTDERDAEGHKRDPLRELAGIVGRHANLPISRTRIAAVVQAMHHRVWGYLAEREVVPTLTPREDDMPEPVTDADLFGWDAIADHMGVARRTVIRWANEHGLPVRRFSVTGETARVEASSDELREWRKERTESGAA